jgi:hypothetical protein
VKICVVSDSHDRRETFARVLQAARDAGAECALHCGDIIAPSTLLAVRQIGLPLHVIHGNNSGDLGGLTRIAQGDWLRYHGQDASLQMAGRRVFLVHYPHYARALALTGDYDLVCFGHDHTPHLSLQPNIHGGQTWLLNPGSAGGVDGPPRYILGDLTEMTFSLHTLQPADSVPA